jgi:hypothetical protein
MRTFVAVLLSSHCIIAALTLPAPAAATSFTFAAIGDVPYGQPDELGGLAQRINRAAPAFTIHVGDIKSGSSPCNDEAFATVRRLFDEFEQPLVYTPGDNEWTDCHRRSCGQYDPLERLDKLRTMFFASEHSFGKRKLALQSQASQAGFGKYVENRRWSMGKVSFVTLHLVGSNNNWQPELPSVSEYAGRDDANIAWLRDSFARAKARKDVAIVLAMQADTFYGEPKAGSGFTRWMAALAEEVDRWGKPVLLVQGDTHLYKIDQPLMNAKGKPLPQLTRVVVPGEHKPDAVMITVDDERIDQPFALRLLGN